LLAFLDPCPTRSSGHTVVVILSAGSVRHSTAPLECRLCTVYNMRISNVS
jgi:hypothetical protein